jgi:hypothetical protein
MHRRVREHAVTRKRKRSRVTDFKTAKLYMMDAQFSARDNNAL